jgi:hypothetical protein
VPYHDELLEETHRIKALDLLGLRITSVGRMGDCSGLRVTVGGGTDLTRGLIAEG